MQLNSGFLAGISENLWARQNNFNGLINGKSDPLDKEKLKWANNKQTLLNEVSLMESLVNLLQVYCFCVVLQLLIVCGGIVSRIPSKDMFFFSNLNEFQQEITFFASFSLQLIVRKDFLVRDSVSTVLLQPKLSNYIIFYILIIVILFETVSIRATKQLT